MKWEVIQGETLEAMRGMADSSFALIVADPPYFKVKDDDWDNQWKTEADFLRWIGLLCDEWRRILKPNGSLYVFASLHLSRKVGNEIAERFNVLTDIRWRKPEFSTKAEMFCKEDLRTLFPSSEALLFAEQCNADSISLFADVMRDNMRRLSLSQGDLSSLELSRNGNQTGWIFNKLSGSQIPTPIQWAKITQLFGIEDRYAEMLRDHHLACRPFNATADAPYTDVWDFPTVGSYKGKHPCEKPMAMMRHIVNISSREGDAVLDCFAGSFVLGDAALKLNRSYVGIDGSAHWCEQGRRRLALSGEQGNITLHNLVEFKRANERTIKTERALPLFDCPIVKNEENDQGGTENIASLLSAETADFYNEAVA